MIKRKKELRMRIYVALISACLFCTSAIAQELVFGFRHYPPLAYINEMGQPTGTYVESILKPVKARSGLDIVFKQFPVKRLYKSLELGGVDILVSPERGVIKAELAVWGKVPVVVDYIELFSYLPVISFDAIEDFQNTVLGGVRGYTFAGRITEIKDPKFNIKFHAATDHHSLFQMLKANRIQYALAYSIPANEALKQIDAAGLQQKTIYRVDSFFTISLRHKNAQLIVDKMDEALTEILAER